MQRVPTKRAICAVSWALCAVCMTLIFYFSSRNGEASTLQSQAVLEFLEKIFGRELTGFIVRKAAHFTEFAGLGFLLANALYQSRKKHGALWAAGLTSLYAVTDEVHQLFVPGRACQIGDWLLDSAGGLTGAAVFAAAAALLHLILKKRRAKNSGESA